MNDERIFAGFRTALDERVDPDPAFADRLYETLAVDLGLQKMDDARPRGLAGRLARALGAKRRSANRRALRVAMTATVAALLLALALMAALIVGQALRTPEPILTGDAIALHSQSLYPNPPAFDMTVRFWGIDVVRYRYDGGENLRTDVLKGSLPESSAPVGSYVIETATKQAIYHAGEKSWYVADLPAPRPPLFSMFPINWIAPKPFKPPEPPPGYTCASWQREADAIAAERPAYHITCGPQVDFWIDQESSLVVGSGTMIAATSLTVGLAPDPSLFALVMPAGAYDANHPPPSTTVVVGQTAPDWTGPIQGGGTFDSRTLLGSPAAIYFWADWCEPCIGDQLRAFNAAARSHPGVGFVSVAWKPAGESTLKAAIDASGGGVPVVRDDAGGQIVASWGLTAVPTLALLRADGSVASLTLGPLSTIDRDAMLAALAAGQPIPSPTASDGPCTCSAAPR